MMTLMLEGEALERFTADIKHIVDALPQLEKMAKCKLKAASPAAHDALQRLAKLAAA